MHNFSVYAFGSNPAVDAPLHVDKDVFRFWLETGQVRRIAKRKAQFVSDRTIYMAGRDLAGPDRYRQQPSEAGYDRAAMNNDGRRWRVVDQTGWRPGRPGSGPGTPGWALTF